MDNIVCLKNVCDDFEVEFEIIPCDKYIEVLDTRNQIIEDSILDIDHQLAKISKTVDDLNVEIDRLTNHADGLDYAIAVSSGIIAGLIDIFIVGEWDFATAKDISNEKMNRKIEAFANKDPKYKGKSLQEAVAFLEGKYKLPGDNTWKGKGIGITAKSHHLDDFCHHPTIVGLICCIIAQFTKKTIYSNSEGELIRLPITVDDNGKLEGKTPAAKVSAGIINWCFNVARNRKGHLLSDMAGSKKTAGGGMGVPGSIISTLKELSALPIIKDTEFPQKLAKAYQKGFGEGKGKLDLGAFNALFEGRSSKMDARTEMAITHEVKRQAMPVVLNEIIVRSFYFIRRFIQELKDKNDLTQIEWKNVLPFRNRTIVRMMTIATGTFTAMDVADAAIRSAVKSGGINPAFLSNMILRVNFVGVGRFTIAVGTDVGMGVKKGLKRNQRIELYNEMLSLTNSKVFYKQADMWMSAETTEKTINEAYDKIEETTIYFMKSYEANKKSLENISSLKTEIEENNDELIGEISEVLKWG
ncbi:MAG: hypothetical protein K8R73_08945 [Clostridiales bacterium]|nr:hypothetical protein [Clostridiales bacterium]